MRKSGFIEGAIIATLAIFFTKFIGIIYVIPFYKIIGTQGGALYGYAYNIYNLFLIISSAGIPLAISKLTSEYNALDEIAKKEYMLKIAKKCILIFSIVSFLICFIFAPTIGRIIIGENSSGNTFEDIAFVIRCVSFAILVVPLLSINRGYLQGHGYISPASFSQVIEQLVRVAVVIGGSYYVLKILHLSLRTAIGVAVFGACVGAIVAYLYLAKKLFKIKTSNVSTDKLTKSEKSEIIKKIIMYSIPFIVTNIAGSLYNTADMILLLRGLKNIGYDDITRETISSVFTTWGHKLNSIITSIATGLAISLIPNVAKSNVKGDLESINSIFNKTLQIFFYVALPLALFMSVFANQVWLVFYGHNEFGPIVFRFYIITAAVDALYIMICNGLQGLNRFKLIYIAITLGLIIKIVLELPLIYLFNSIGIYPYYGAIAATLIGYTISLIIPLRVLKTKYKLDYSDTLKKLPKLFIVYLLLILISLGYRGIINGIDNKLYLIGLLLLIGIILLAIYYYLNKKDLEEILGSKAKNIFKRKKREE